MKLRPLGSYTGIVTSAMRRVIAAVSALLVSSLPLAGVLCVGKCDGLLAHTESATETGGSCHAGPAAALRIGQAAAHPCAPVVINAVRFDRPASQSVNPGTSASIDPHVWQALPLSVLPAQLQGIPRAVGRSPGARLPLRI